MENLSFIQMLDFAMMAYSDTPTTNLFDKLHFENVKDIGIQYFIGKQPEKKQVIIAFRGTDSLQDFFTDMKFWKKRPAYGNALSKIRIHSGFYNAYNHELVREKIRYFVKDNVENIYVTGHSYGAALALLCALDLQYHFPEKFYEVVVFGCPRIGNKAFAKSYNKRLVKTIRFENGNDLVTKIPPALMGFRHAGVKIHIGSPRLLGMYNLQQHNTARYYESLWKAR